MSIKHGFLAASTAAVLTMALAAGCGGKPDVPDAAKEAQKAEEATAPSVQGSADYTEKEPVKLLYMQKWSEITGDEFQKKIAEPLTKKYPNISIEVLNSDNAANLIAAGTTPDVIATYHGLLPEFQQLDLLDDMTPLIKKYNVDLGRFDPVYLDTIRSYGNGGLVALPYDVNFEVIYYNKDLFDKFGVAYPKDGMTWNETVELARKLSRTDGGQQYRGLEVDGYGRLAMQLALPSVKDGKAYINNESWKRIFELARTIYTIPGNEPMPNVHYRDQFLKNKNLAMLAAGYMFNLLGREDAQSINWDLAQYPSYADNPNSMGMVDEHVVFVTKTSKNKDAAFQVARLMTSDAYQKDMTRTSGKLTVLKDSSIKSEMGADMPVLQGKHIEAILKGHHIPAYKPEKYQSEAGKFVSEQFDKYLQGTQDLNTSLRTAEEEINRMIAAENSK